MTTDMRIWMNLVEAVDPEWKEYVRPKAKVDPNRWYDQTDLFFGPDDMDAPWLDEEKFKEFGERLDEDSDWVMFQMFPEEYADDDFEMSEDEITFDQLLGRVQNWFQEYRIWTDYPVWLVDMKFVEHDGPLKMSWVFKLAEEGDDPDEY